MTPSELRAWRLARHLNIDTAAELFGVSRRTYIAWEQGGDGRADRPKFEEIPQIAALAWEAIDRRLRFSKIPDNRD